MITRLGAALILLTLAGCDIVAGSWIEASSGLRPHELPEAAKAKLPQHNAFCLQLANEAASAEGPRYTFCHPSAFVIDSTPTGHTLDCTRVYETCMRERGYEFELSPGVYRCKLPANAE